MWLWEDRILGVRLWTLGVGATLFIMAGIGDALLRWFVRRRVRRERSATGGVQTAQKEPLHWFHEGLKACVPPLSLLLWIAAGYLALSMTLAEFAYREAATLVAWAVRWLAAVGTMAGLFWLLARVGRIIETWLTPLGSLTASTWDDALLPVAGKAARVLLPILALILGIPVLGASPGVEIVLENGLTLVLIGVSAFLLYQVVVAAEAMVLERYRLDAKDNLEARTVYTQVTVLRKIATVVIGIFTLASMLMTFDSVRQFGTSIIASAGIAGIIIGFAAQRSIATLLAGLQIALTQPIRFDDVVIVQNEFGRVEDISLTYVIVRLWDERRLVVPITYFLEQPFQNWTRTSAEKLGAVVFHVDYSIPLAAMRAELDRILEASPLWDRKVKGLQVTEAREHTLEVRALASAANASAAWDLRCEVREKLIAFVQEHHPGSLPRFRAQFGPREASHEALRAGVPT